MRVYRLKKGVKRIFALMLVGVFLLPLIPATQISATTKGQAIVNYARSFVNRPDKIKYSYGGNGPLYYDCSSFTQKIFKESMNISLPRTAAQQSLQGNYVSRNNLQPGDLIFFGSSSNVTHVGIYAGNDMMIHNSSSYGHVVEVNLTSYINYNKNYYTARRIIANDYQPVHVGEYINVKPFMKTFPIFKSDKHWETWDRLVLLSAPISVKVLDNPSKNVYKVKDCRYGYVGYAYVEETVNYTFTSSPAYKENALYKGISDGVQITDQCLAKWIPGIVEEQINKAANKIVITKINDTSASDYPFTKSKANGSTLEMYATDPLYKVLVDGKQVTDLCSTKWIPGIIEEQLIKEPAKIEILRVR